jgi:nucleotide-binding universal stress UspA family protein
MTAFGSILAVQGAGSAQDGAAAAAVRLARDNRAALTVVDVIEGDDPAPDLVAARRARLTAAAEAARGEGLEASEAVLHGSPAIEVIRMVLREGHDLVVVGPGEATEGLIRDCPCPVMVVKPDGFATSVTLQGAGGQT